MSCSTNGTYSPCQDALFTCVAYHKKYLLDLQTIPLLQNFSHLRSIRWIAI